MKISTLILAAGSSSRLGRPKQLLRFKGKTLIERITQVALSVSDQVLIVLGANETLIRPHLEALVLANTSKLEISFNADWEEGMGKTLSFGVEKLAKNADAILVLLSDQLFVDEVLLRKMMQTFAESNLPIVACEYAEQLAVPILFDKTVFADLMSLSGDKGAKVLLKKYSDKLGSVPFPLGICDVDTPEDLKKFELS